MPQGLGSEQGPISDTFLCHQGDFRATAPGWPITYLFIAIVLGVKHILSH